MTAEDKQKIEYVPIESIKPYERNPRHNEGAVDACAAAIEAFGFRGAIEVDENMVIVCGHTRRLAAMKLGMKTVPVVVDRDLAPEQIKARRIIDNKISQLSTWNEDLLKLEAAEIDAVDMADFGFTPMELYGEDAGGGEEESGGEDEELFDPDAEPTEIRVRRGEIWKLGDHRLMCGDSTKPEDVAALMDGELADLWLTDPPYNVNYGARGDLYKKRAEDGHAYQAGSDNRKILNDNMDDESFRTFLRKVYANAKANLRAGATGYVFHSDSEGYNFRGAAKDVGLAVVDCLVWRKDSLVLGRQDYQWIHEPFLLLQNGEGPVTWNGGDGQTTVLEFPRPKKSELHPTMKPVSICAHLIKNSTDAGDAVLETFGGSGSTLIAAERTRRRCFCIELDEKYATTILDRWEAETGRKGEMLRGGEAAAAENGTEANA